MSTKQKFNPPRRGNTKENAMNTIINSDPRSILAGELDQARQRAQHWHAAYEDSRVATGWADPVVVADLAMTAPSPFLSGLLTAAYLALFERPSSTY
jgi:hypothetical protein